MPTVPMAVGDDVDALADLFRPYTALYVGGMGSAKQNFYNKLAQRMGYEKEAAEIQEKYLSGDKQGAAAAVPRQLIDSTALLGSVDRIAERMQAYAQAGVTTLSLAPRRFHAGRAHRRAAHGRRGAGAGRARLNRPRDGGPAVEIRGRGGGARG
ncbi:hypothetical protein GCM10020000_64400 [Streptomyces olivoverticillatus]